MSLIHSLPTARETNVPGSSSSAVLNRERRETGVSSDSRSKRKGYIYILVVFREAAGFGRRARARCNPQRGPGYTRGGAASTWPSPAPLPFFSRASALLVVRTAGRNSFLYGYIFASSKRESSSAYPQGFLRPSPLLVPGCAALWTSGGSTDRTLFPLDPPISSLLFKKHERETISSFVKTKTINIQRFVARNIFLQAIHYIATNFSPDIYKTVAKWPTNDTLDGGSERERRKLGEPISIRRAATPSLPRFRPTTQFRNFTRLRCSIDKLFRACCTRAGACAFQRGVHCRCTHPRLTPFLFIFQWLVRNPPSLFSCFVSFQHGEQPQSTGEGGEIGLETAITLSKRTFHGAIIRPLPCFRLFGYYVLFRLFGQLVFARDCRSGVKPGVEIKGGSFVFFVAVVTS